MQALRAVAADLPKVLLDNTPSLYFGRYPIKIEFQAEIYASRALPVSQRYRWRGIHDELLADLGLTGRVKARRRDVFTTLYCQNEVDALALCTRLGGTIVTIACPRHAGDIAALTGDETRVRPVLREALYWDRFRYRLTLDKTVREEATKFEEIKDWVAQFCTLSDEDPTARVENGAPPRAYFSREEDVTYFKLVFHEFIRDFEKVILFKEIDDAREPVEAVC